MNKIAAFIFILPLLSISCRSNYQPARNGFIGAGNLQVYYERSGKGEPLLLLHAGLQDHTMWKEQVKELSEFYDVITPDLPFHGQTTGIDTLLLAQDVIRIFLDSLQIQKISIAGLSMGSSIAQDFIIAYPSRVNKAILISPGLYGYDKTHAIDSASMNWYNLFAKALEEKDTARAAREFTRAWAEGIFRRSDSLQSPVSRYVYDKSLVNLRLHKMAGWPLLKDDPRAIESISRISTPVLVIDGDKDLPYITAVSQYLEKNLPGARRVVMKDVAHMLNMEKPAELNKLMLDFLKSK